MPGRRALTQEQYEIALKLFRELPGNYAEVARRVPCGWRLAKRLWLGPPYETYPWARPIQLVLEDERRELLAVRAQMTRQAADADAAAREEARRSQLEALAQEAQMMRVARADVLNSLALAAELAAPMRLLVRAITAACQPQADGSPPAVPPVTAMTLLTRHTQMIQRAVGAAEVLVQLGRLDRGQSTANVGVGGFSPEMSLEDALLELEGLESFVAEQRTKVPALGAKGVSAAPIPGSLDTEGLALAGE